METRSKLTALLLGAMVLIGVYYSEKVPVLELEVDQAILAGSANILLVFFVLALLIERACEVALELLTAVGALPSEKTSETGGDRSDRKMVSIFVCLAFATVVSLLGLRLVEMILNVATPTDLKPEGYFSAVDALLTSLVLAGGSDGIHQILRPLLGGRSSLEEQ